MSETINDKAENGSNASLDERMCIFFKNPAEGREVADMCKEKAEAGDYSAMLWLARMYRDGIGIRKNNSKALEWYKRSKDHNIFSKFELLAMLSNYKVQFRKEDVPDGLNIETRIKEKLLVYKLGSNNIDILVRLFPFTHYNVTGFSYDDETQIGSNGDCGNFDKILIADMNNSSVIKEELISKGISAERIIIVRKYLEKDKFDGDAIICDFSNKASDRATWVITPSEVNGLIWFLNTFKLFKGIPSSECDYLVDMENHFSELQDYGGLGRYNPWDYFFKPISSLTLEKAYSRMGVIISAWKPVNKVRADIKPEVSDIISTKIDQELWRFEGRKKIIGLVCRGTDYISAQPYGHEVPLDEYELIEVVAERMKTLGFTDVYVNTEDQNAYDAFVNHFGSRAFAIDQKRFKKGSKLNTAWFEGKEANDFEKLLQGERYLVATCLTTVCDSAIVTSGSGSAFVRTNMRSKVTEKHVKGRWGYFGKSQIVVRSHNKNRIMAANLQLEDETKVNLDSKGRFVIRGIKTAYNDIEIILDANIEYICSFECKSSNSISINLTLFSADEKSSLNMTLSEGSVFKVPFDVKHGNLIIYSTFSGLELLGIQIEEGTSSTDYESPRYSETQICIRDPSHVEYSPTDLDYLDFSKGIFSVGMKEHKLDSEEVDRYHKIICYAGGYLTYHHGETEILYGETETLRSALKFTKTSVDKTHLIPKCVYGTPRQLRRYSYTIEQADTLMQGSENDIKKALEIYNFHARNGDYGAMKKLGMIYRNGKVLEKNLDKAVDYERQSMEGGENGAINELIMALLERGNNEDLKEAFNLASDFSKYDNPGLAVHLARMYYRGLGVTRSLDEAIRYMKIASDRGHGLAKKELIDLLLKRKKDYDIELAAILSNDLENNGPNLYRKALIMRESGGSVEKVIQCMSSVANNGNKNAKEDLFYLLQSRSEWQKQRPNFSYYSKDNYNLSEYALLKGAYDPLNPLKSLGWNTGNLAFLSAIEKLFHPDVLPPEYLKDKSSKYECLIVTDLIWIRENVDFSYLENRLKDVKIPIVLMSVGLQSPENKIDFKLHDSVIRILKRVQETSVIGVRGEYTEKILNNNGIYNTQVIGCPSMYYWNDRNYKIKNEDCQIDAIGNFRTFYNNKPLTKNETEFIRFLKKWNCPFVEQTSERLVPSLLSDDKDTHELCNYVNRMSAFYYSNKEWIDAIKKFNFSIGSRFHGNVMGIRAGFKSLFLITDSRTEEMTSFFNLPSLKIENFDSGKPMSYYYELADYSDFNKYYPNLFDEFDKFIQKNGMKIKDE
jgi:TPR repeat protein